MTDPPISVDESEAGLLRGLAYALLLSVGVGALLGVVMALWILGY